MKNYKLLIICINILLLAFLPLTSTSMEISSDLLEITEKCDGILGIHAINLTTGKEMHLNANEFFSIENIHELILAAYILNCVNTDNLKLDGIYHQTEYSSCETDKLTSSAPVACTIKTLLEDMLCNSESNATAQLTDLVSNKEIDRWLCSLGFPYLRYKAPMNDWLRKQKFKPFLSRAGQQLILNSTEAPWYVRSAAKFCSTFLPESGVKFVGRNTKLSPEEITSFLTDCFQEDSKFVPNPTHRALLAKFLLQCPTGKNRISKYFPTTVYHRSGSGNGICYDTAFIKSEKNSVALTIFIKDSFQPLEGEEGLEEIIARAAIAAYSELTESTEAFL